MPANEILSERREQALVLTFNRPDFANSMTLDMANQLFTVLKNVTTDKSVRAVLLRGAGGNFMDGIDMSIYENSISTGQEIMNQIILPYHSAIRELQTMEKPVIAAVEGKVTGMGFSFMLATDLVISDKEARFNTRFAQYAMTPDGGCSYYLSRKMGLSRAVEMMMMSEDMSAAEAESNHLVNRVADEGQLENQAFAWLDRLAKGPTKAYGAIKKLALKASILRTA